MDEREPRGRYQALVACHEAAVAGLTRRSLRLSTARVVTFLAAVAALLAADAADGAPARWAAAAAVALGLLFAVEVAVHRRVRTRTRWHETLRGLAAEGLVRLDRRWRDLARVLPAAEARTEPPPPDHPYAADLDVLGEASLVRLAGPVTSERGRATLRRWLLASAAPAEVGRRQAAVRELAPALDLRMTFAAHGRLHAAEEPPEVGRFLAWAEGAPWLVGRPGLRGAAAVLPFLLVGLGIADFAYGADPFWVLPALAQAELLRRVWGRVRGELRAAEEGNGLVASHVPQLLLVEEHAAAAPALGDLARRIGAGAGGASRRLKRLGRLLDTVESRRNVIYATLSPVLFLDVHLAVALDRWRRASGAAVRDWLEALGEWEALAALASIAHDHPDWGYPAFVAADDGVLRATALGHPLLPSGSCVRNDVEVGPPGTFLLVTGSNMSGKSTLLRALGANVVLAGAGAPACAAALSVPPVRVRTCMRVDDSLAEGISLFMAELLRIRGVVDAVHADPGAPRVLYLLDEILHGTNTAERRVAARAVLRHLLAGRAFGAVSTHDLTLADAPDLEAAARAVHFREQVSREEGRTRLTFDYTLRPGLATTRNALKLLDAVGLGGLLPDEGDAEP